MKRYVLLFLLFVLILSAQAQRRHNHFRRVKVEKIESVETTHRKAVFVEKENNNVISTIVGNMQESQPEVIVNAVTSENKTIETRSVSKSVVKKNVFKESQNISLSFFQNILKTHLRLAKVKDVKQTNLRTWKWLLIIACILVVMGVILAIVASSFTYPGPLLVVIGLVVAGIGLIAAIIILILGLSGRI